MKKLLVVVDYQVDFVCGALGFPGAEKLEGGIVSVVEQTLAEGGCVIFTRDTHGEDYLETREGKGLPVAHCIKGQEGHQLYGRLREYETAARPNTLLLDKPTFGSPELAAKAEALCGGAPDEIELCGLVTDICVIANAVILHTAFPQARVKVLESLVGSGNAEGAAKALDVLRGLHIQVAD